MARLHGPAPQQPIQVVDIPLDQGITTYGTGYQIGRVPRRMNNIVWTERAFTATVAGGRHTDWAPAVANSVTATMAAADAGHTNRYLLGIGRHNVTPVAIGVFTAPAAQLGLWNALTGAALHAVGSSTYTAITSSVLTQRVPAAWAYWPSQATLYYSHAQAVSAVMEYPPGGPCAVYGTSSGRASALAVHLDRLFLAKPGGTAGTGFGAETTLIQMTDPLDPATIRASRSFTVEGEVRGLLRLSAGDLDLAGQSHLLIGGVNSIGILDGDPDVGNASYRVLDDTIGVQAQTLWTNTPFGVFALCSDGQLYNIPQGAGDKSAVGSNIRDQFTGFKNIPYSTAPATLLWDPPFLHLFPPDQVVSPPVTYGGGVLSMNLEDPGTPQWTGPHTIDAAVTRSIMGAIRLPETTTADRTLYCTSQGDGTLQSYGITTTATGRRQVIETGYLHEPGHDITIARVGMVVHQDASDVTYTCQLNTTGNVTRTTTQTVTGIGVAARDRTAKVIFTFNPARGEAISITISAATAARLSPLRLFAEVRVEPRQDAYP